MCVWGFWAGGGGGVVFVVSLGGCGLATAYVDHAIHSRL